MKLYFGGAYNGKLKYIKEVYNIDDEEIFYCNNSEIDFSKRVISGIDKLIYFNTISGVNSLDYFTENIENLKGKIIISDEISQGIVPLRKEDRSWREETGRVLQFLTKESTFVCRIFCGIPMILKEE